LATATALYKCADGRDFAVEWPSAEDAARKWFWDPEHNPTPATPLDQAAWLEKHRGALRAWVEAGYPESDPFDQARWFHGFGYYAEAAPAPEYIKQSGEASAALNSRYGGPLKVWEQRCVPLIEASLRKLQEAPDDTPLPALFDEFGYGYEQTFLRFWVGGRDDLRAFMTRELGEGNDLVAVELMQGYPTATMEADQALWELAEKARGSCADRLLGSHKLEAKLRQRLVMDQGESRLERRPDPPERDALSKQAANHDS